MIVWILSISSSLFLEPHHPADPGTASLGLIFFGSFSFFLASNKDSGEQERNK
jgi:hypothetical protein